MSIFNKHAVRKNFEQKVSYIAKAVPPMVVAEHGSFLAVDCGLPSDTFNVIVARDLSRSNQILNDGVGYFTSKSFPVALWYWEDNADKSRMSALTAYGLTHDETNIAMYAELIQSNFNVTSPEGLMIKCVETSSEIQQYGSVLASLFGASEEGNNVAAYFNLLSKQPISQFPAMRHYIGKYQGEVVATGALFVDRETVGIYDIATHASYRHKGIGSAMFAHLLKEAKFYQRRYAVLQASAEGIGIYLKAGFAPLGNVHVFENRSLL